MECLLIDSDTGRQLVIENFPALIGRNRHVDVVLEDCQVSAHQCMLDLAPNGQVVVCDLGHGMGTFLNGRRIVEAALQPGDELTIGGTNLVFFDGQDFGIVGRRYREREALLT